MKLRLRLPLYFLIVAVSLTLMNSILVIRTTDSRFRAFISAEDTAKAEVYAGLLGKYHEDHQSWEGVQDFLEELPHAITENLESGIFLQNDEELTTPYLLPVFDNLLADRVVLVDDRGTVIADSANKLIGTAYDRDDGVAIDTDSGRIGTALVGSLIDASLTEADLRSLAATKRSMYFPFFISVFFAIVLGLLLSLRIIKPVSDLTRGVQEIIGSHRFEPVPIRGNDELTELARVFNEMVTELKNLDAAKKQIIADAAHELRTPVTLIRGTVEGMLDGILPMDSENLTSVLEEVLRLSQLIDLLRELKLIDAGELKLSRQPVDMRVLVSKSIALFKPVANEKHLSIEFSPKEEDNPLVLGDFLRLREVIDNLIVNAIKYTPRGGKIRIDEQEGEKGSLSLVIEDSGPGIDVKERERVFQRFYRIDKSRSSESGGRGLGLAISAEIIQAHGGSISIGTSSLGGASFHIILPCAAGMPPRKEAGRQEFAD